MFSTWGKNFVMKNLKLCFFGAFVFFIACQSGYGQFKYGRIDSDVYRSNLGKYLLPDTDTSDVKVILEFMETPSFETEYAIRIVKQCDQYIFEGRFFRKSYSEELSSNLELGKNLNFIPEVLSRSVRIGDDFAKKLQVAFFNTVVRLSDNNRDYQSLDGTEYMLWLNDGIYRNNKIVSNPRKGDNGYDLIMLFAQMASDLKNQSFDELKYKVN